MLIVQHPIRLIQTLLARHLSVNYGINLIRFSAVSLTRSLTLMRFTGVYNHHKIYIFML
jgi:hypothetical protein